jgi:hypothetical protein
MEAHGPVASCISCCSYSLVYLVKVNKNYKVNKKSKNDKKKKKKTTYRACCLGRGRAPFTPRLAVEARLPQVEQTDRATEPGRDGYVPEGN